jgi:hypothetical protein
VPRNELSVGFDVESVTVPTLALSANAQEGDQAILAGIERWDRGDVFVGYSKIQALQVAPL